MTYFARTIAFSPDDERVHEVRPAHREYVAQLHARGAIRMSGPFAQGDGALLIYNAESRAVAERLIAEDPYCVHAVVDEVSLREWNVVVE